MAGYLNTQGSNIYGTTVALDSTPYTRYALDVQARNKAKDEAVMRSFQDLAARATPAGMDGVDISDFMQKKQDWQNYVMQNSDAYKNPAKDNGKVYGEAMRRYNDVLGVVQLSKDKLEALKPLYQLYADPDKRKLISEQTLMDAHNATLPVSDPNFRKFNPAAIQFNAPDFDTDQLQKYVAGVKNVAAPALKNKTYGTPIIDKDTSTKITPYTIKLSDSDLNNIRGYASTWSGINPGFANFLDKELNNPTDYEAYNTIFKDHYGKDANIKSREDMATALALSNISSDLKGEERGTYTDTFGNQLIMEQIRQQNRIALKNIPSASSSGTTPQEANQAVDNYINQLLQSAEPRKLTHSNGTTEDRVEIQPSPELQEAFAVKTGNSTYYPDQIHYDPKSKKWSSIFYKRDAEGNFSKNKDGSITLNNTLSKTYDNSAVRVRVADKFLGIKDLKQVMQEPKVAAPKTQQPAKKTIKKSDIAGKATAAGYDVKEYMKLLKDNGIQIVE